MKEHVDQSFDGKLDITGLKSHACKITQICKFHEIPKCKL